MLPYAPGQSLSEAAYAVLGATYGDALTDVAVRLPEGLGSVAPARLGAIPAGGEVFVTARMNNLELAGDVVLTGRLGGRPFEQRYPVKLSASDARGNVFVERLYAAARIQDLERDGTDFAKKEAIGLSSRFSVASRAPEAGFGGVSTMGHGRRPQAERRLRPLARRRARMRRPPAVSMRLRNPWRRLRTSRLG